MERPRRGTCLLHWNANLGAVVLVRGPRLLPGPASGRHDCFDDFLVGLARTVPGQHDCPADASFAGTCIERCSGLYHRRNGGGLHCLPCPQRIDAFLDLQAQFQRNRSRGGLRSSSAESRLDRLGRVDGLLGLHLPHRCCERASLGTNHLVGAVLVDGALSTLVGVGCVSLLDPVVDLLRHTNSVTPGSRVLVRESLAVHHFFLVAASTSSAQPAADRSPTVVVIPALAGIHETHDVGNLVRNGVVQYVVECLTRQHVAVETHEIVPAPAMRHSSAATPEVEANAHVVEVQVRPKALGLRERCFAGVHDLLLLGGHLLAPVCVAMYVLCANRLGLSTGSYILLHSLVALIDPSPVE